MRAYGRGLSENQDVGIGVFCIALDAVFGCMPGRWIKGCRGVFDI